MKRKLLIGLLAVSAIFGLASCQKEKYLVSFDTNDGTTIEAIEVTENGLITGIADPTKEGHVFGGWYSDEELTQEVKFESYKVVGEVTLYAKWIANEYTVTFNSNGGSSVASQTVKYGSSVQLPANPTLEGYNFAGWYTDATLTTPYVNAKIKGDTTLYAKWRSAVLYTGTYSGEATYNEDGTYTFTLELQIWGRFTILYNNVALSANDENLIISGLYNASNTADWTMNLYCDVAEGGSEVDYTTFLTCTGGKYVVTYDPASNTLDIQDGAEPIVIPSDGLYVQHTDGVNNELTELTKIEVGADGSYSFTVELAQWRYVKMYYMGEVVDTAVNATLESSGNIYIGDSPDPTYAFYTNAAGTFDFKYIPADGENMAVVQAGPHVEAIEIPTEGVYYMLYDNNHMIVSHGVVETVENVASITLNMVQWGYCAFLTKMIKISTK